MPTIRIEGTPVHGFEYRKTFEELASIKPPNLKVVQHDATAWFDSPHYAQVAALTNKPGPEAEQWLQELEEQNQMQQAIQQMNLDGQRNGVIPRAGPQQPVGIQANLADVQAHQQRAIDHEQRALLQAQNDGLQDAMARAAMGQAVAPQDLADQGADQRLAVQLLRNIGGRIANVMPGQRARAMVVAGGGRMRQGLGELVDVARGNILAVPGLANQAGPYMGMVGQGMQWALGEMGHNARGNLMALPGAWRQVDAMGRQVVGVAVRALEDQRRAQEERDQAGSASSSNARTRALALGGSSVPAALRNTPQGESIVREQIAELTVRADRLWAMGATPQFQAVQAEIERLQMELASFNDPLIARDRRRVRQLEEEAQELYDAGDQRGAEAIWAQIGEIRDSIRFRMGIAQ